MVVGFFTASATWAAPSLPVTSPQFPSHQSFPAQCSAYQATRSLSTSASQHWVSASFPGWAAQTGRPFWGHGSHSTKGRRSFLPAQPGRAVWGCPRPPGGGVGKPLGLQSNLKPDSARAPRQLAVGPSRLCGFQEARLRAVPWPTTPASAGMRSGCLLPASVIRTTLTSTPRGLISMKNERPGRWAPLRSVLISD